MDALEDSDLEVRDAFPKLQERTMGIPGGLVTDTEIVERFPPPTALVQHSERFVVQE